MGATRVLGAADREKRKTAVLGGLGASA